jgi:hypothetical protein
MKLKVMRPIVLMLTLLMVVSLACNIFESEPDATDTPVPTNTSAPTPTEPEVLPSPTFTVPPPPPPATKPPAVEPTQPPAGGPLGNPDASAPGELFFETDFDDNENWGYRAIPTTDKFQAYTQRSALYIQVDTTQTTLYVFYDLVLNNPDVQLEAAVETIAGPNRNNISLVCRYTEAGFYEFSMNSGGYWYIWKYDGKYTELLRGASTAIHLQKAKNQLKATCINRDLTFYVNDVEMGSVQDNTFRDGGKAGVSVTAFDITGPGVEFDWFRATVP